jgi:tetratricopeptide (TPR) repeat protein
MKTRILLPGLLTGIFLSTALFAQTDKYGDDPEACREKLSTYNEFFNQNNFKDAYPSWNWCYVNCPASTKNLYIHGPKIMEYFIGETTDDKVKQLYVDSLLTVYDKRIQYFGEEGKVVGIKASDLLKYRPDSIAEVYRLYKRSVELSGIASSPSVLVNFVNMSVVNCKSGKISPEDALNDYTIAADLFENQIKEMKASGNTDKIENTEKLAAKAEEIFTTSGLAKCESIIELFTPRYEANPNDEQLLKKIAGLIEKTRSQDCLTTDLYAKVSESLYAISKTADAAYKIAKVYYLKGNYDKSEFYYLEAISLSEENTQKTDLCFELASIYFGNLKQYVKAREYARKTLAINPNFGEAYILIGRIYAAGGRGCGETEFEQKSLNWLIVDQFVKAKSVSTDPEVIKEANELIGRYSGGFPTREEVFWLNRAEGETVTIGCWIGESTIIRCNK